MAKGTGIQRSGARAGRRRDRAASVRDANPEPGRTATAAGPGEPAYVSDFTGIAYDERGAPII
ncbi:hypothetical protein [Allosphingosinicella deserti]|nr:hypothetical protein [Sphingomonas deserti]